MMQITYLGQCGFLLDFGTVRVVTDPYLSDYVDRECATEQLPWSRSYPPVADLESLRPDCVLFSHSHEDHMDPWTIERYRASGGDAVMIAPAPECALLEQNGFSRICPAVAEQPIAVGDAVITPIPCAHTQLHQDEQGRYRELSYFIECGGTKVFFAGDMSFYSGVFERISGSGAQVMLLPCNGRTDELTALGCIGNIDCREAAQLAAAGGATLVPMHHDLYAINGCPVETIEAAAAEAKAALRVLKPGETWILQNA